MGLHGPLQWVALLRHTLLHPITHVWISSKSSCPEQYLSIQGVHCRTGVARWGQVMHICISKLTIIGSHNDLAPTRRQVIVNWTPRNKFQWNLNQNPYFLIEENAFETVVWKMSAILSQPQCGTLQKKSWNRMQAYMYKWDTYKIGVQLKHRKLTTSTSGQVAQIYNDFSFML